MLVCTKATTKQSQYSKSFIFKLSSFLYMHMYTCIHRYTLYTYMRKIMFPGSKAATYVPGMNTPTKLPTLLFVICVNLRSFVCCRSCVSLALSFYVHSPTEGVYKPWPGDRVTDPKQLFHTSLFWLFWHMKQTSQLERHKTQIAWNPKFFSRKICHKTNFLGNQTQSKTPIRYGTTLNSHVSTRRNFH